jgi:hypothetical protein
MDVGTRFDLGGGRTGPMAVEDAWELQSQMVSPGHAAANRAVKACVLKFQQRHGLPNSHSLPPGEPDKGTCNIWKLRKKK